MAVVAVGLSSVSSVLLAFLEWGQEILKLTKEFVETFALILQQVLSHML